MISSNRKGGAGQVAGFFVSDDISRLSKGRLWRAGAAGCCDGPASRMSAWM